MNHAYESLLCYPVVSSSGGKWDMYAHGSYTKWNRDVRYVGVLRSKIYCMQ